MKRIIATLLICCVFLTLTACKKENPKQDNNPTSSNVQGGNNVSNKPENVKEAGSDTKLKRDGTYKKYFTLGLDDGITQDARIIEILKKYNAYCATFFINTGLLGKDWTMQVSQQEGKQVSHLRYTEDEIKSGIYKGFDLECHSYTHTALHTLDDNPEALKKELTLDVQNITEFSGYKPVGMSFAAAGSSFTNQTINNILEQTDIRFARNSIESNNFNLPKNFMKWYPTCSIVNKNLLDIAQRFLDTEPTDSDMLFYVWGHGYNLDSSDYWDEFEALIKMLAEDGNVVFVTNAEFYQLFKDQIPSKGSK